MGTGPWPYYARPRLAPSSVHGRVDVGARQQRELEAPEAFEWVQRRALLAAVRAAGLGCSAPLMVLDHGAWRAPEPPSDVTVRHLGHDDPSLPASRAVQNVGFAAAGAAPGSRASPSATTTSPAATSPS